VGVVFNEVRWTDEEKGVFDNMWKCPAPSTVVAFAWRAILNRVATKLNLVLRHVLRPEDHLWCGLCNRVEESANHLFLHCQVASVVWRKLMWWLDYFFILPPNLFIHWECWHVGERDKKVKKGKGIIWLATI
jgi:hypothetical protein